MGIIQDTITKTLNGFTLFGYLILAVSIVVAIGVIIWLISDGKKVK